MDSRITPFNGSLLSDVSLGLKESFWDNFFVLRTQLGAIFKGNNTSTNTTYRTPTLAMITWIRAHLSTTKGKVYCFKIKHLFSRWPPLGATFRNLKYVKYWHFLMALHWAYFLESIDSFFRPNNIFFFWPSPGRHF